MSAVLISVAGLQGDLTGIAGKEMPALEGFAVEGAAVDGAQELDIMN